MLRLPKIKWDLSWITKPWYKYGEYCEFHITKRHDINRCIYLINIIQNIIDSGKLTFNGTLTNPNHNLKLNKHPLP